MFSLSGLIPTLQQAHNAKIKLNKKRKDVLKVRNFIGHWFSFIPILSGKRIEKKANAYPNIIIFCDLIFSKAKQEEYNNILDIMDIILTK